MIKQYLLSPGPTAVPERVLLRMAQPMMHHRTPGFSAIFADTRDMLQKVFQTKQPPIMLSSSGSGAMEAAVANLFSTGDTVIYVNGGKFGERWGKIATAYGLNTVEIAVEWGQAVSVDDVQLALDEYPDARAVLLQASETSTTTEHPVREIAQLISNREDCVIIVDAITALGVIDMPMDDWGLDVVISGSQKAFMLPPGLAMLALSDKAWAMAEDKADCNGFYFNLLAERKSQKPGSDTTAWTPAVSLICGLHEVLTMLHDEGLQESFARHNTLAKATRAGCEALGLKLLSSSPATSATGVYLPENINGAAFVKYARDQMGVTLAGGQDHLKGKIVRIAHLGYYDAFDVVIAMSTLEMALAHFGQDVVFGAGTAAAQNELMARLPK
ncbi:MAG: alanine--glyoxylate aminotransferase family protein [Mariprofundales bacterium]